jgi:Mrp family chromosome partitioning ATPase
VSGKRPGRFGDAPPTTGPGMPPFGDRRGGGAPLPLLTQPMMVVDRGSLHDTDPSNQTMPSVAAALAASAAANVTSAGGPLPTIKLDASAIAMGKPTVTMSAHIKPSDGSGRPSGMSGMSGMSTPLSSPPQVDVTQHHMPEGEAFDPRLQLAIDPDAERSAAFRVLRHHLLEVGRPQVVIVSSPVEGEGKTTTAINLALALAECGRAKTLLVETHVRRPQLSNIFRFVPPWCFAEQLAAHRHQPAMPWSLIDIPQLWLHVAAINPRIAQTQLLDGPAFAIAMERLRLAGYDHIVVDAPPVLGSADVNLMADAADSVVFALRARKSMMRDVRRAIDQLGGRKIAGTILLESA